MAINPTDFSRLPTHKKLIRRRSDEKPRSFKMASQNDTMNSHQQKGKNHEHIIQALSIVKCDNENDHEKIDNDATCHEEKYDDDDKLWWVDVLEQFEIRQEQEQNQGIQRERKLGHQPKSIMNSEGSDATPSTCSSSSINSGDDNHSGNASSSSTDDEENPGIPMSQTKKKLKQKQRLSFAATVLRRKIPLYSTYSTEEWNRCWYTEEEKMTLAAEREKIVERIDSGKPERINTRNPYRGLELWTDEGRSYVRCRIETMINSIIDEQEIQWKTDVDDPDRLALISQMMSIDSVAKALHNAFLDEIDAKRIYSRRNGSKDDRTSTRTAQSSVDHHRRRRRKKESGGDDSFGRRRHGNSPSSSRRRQKEGTNGREDSSPSSGSKKQRSENPSSSSRRLKRSGTLVTKGRNLREMGDPPGPPGVLRSPIPETRKKGKEEVKVVSMAGEVITSDWWNLDS